MFIILPFPRVRKEVSGDSYYPGQKEYSYNTQVLLYHMSCSNEYAFVFYWVWYRSAARSFAAEVYIWDRRYIKKTCIVFQPFAFVSLHQNKIAKRSTRSTSYTHDLTPTSYHTPLHQKKSAKRNIRRTT
jgi:hypothetical protein